MSETSLDNTICASAAEPKQGSGDSGREERHPSSGWIDLPIRPSSLCAGQMLPDKNALAAVGNGGEALSLLVTDEQTNSRKQTPAKCPHSADHGPHMERFSGNPKLGSEMPTSAANNLIEAPRARACQKQRDRISPAADVERWKGGAEPHRLKVSSACSAETASYVERRYGCWPGCWLGYQGISGSAAVWVGHIWTNRRSNSVEGDVIG